MNFGITPNTLAKEIISPIKQTLKHFPGNLFNKIRTDAAYIIKHSKLLSCTKTLKEIKAIEELNRNI